MKKLGIGLVLLIILSNCFAGYSRGGRSGFSSGNRGYSSARSSSYASIGRGGYSRSTNSTRAYVAPRTYSRSYSGTSSNTTIHNNHYSHGGYGTGFGGGFFSGMLGGYLGGSLAQNHHPVVVSSGGEQVITQGQGMLVDNGGYVSRGTSGFFSLIISILMVLFLVLILFWASISIYRNIFNNSRSHNRW